MNTQQAAKLLTDRTVKPHLKEPVLRSLVLNDSVGALYKSFEPLRKKTVKEYRNKCFDGNKYLETDIDIIFIEAVAETKKQLLKNPKKVFSTATFISNQFKWKTTAWYKDKYLSTKIIEVPFGGYDLSPQEDDNNENKKPYWLQWIGNIGGLVAFDTVQFKEEKEPKPSQQDLILGKELQRYFYRYLEYQNVINQRELNLLLYQLDKITQKETANKEGLTLDNVKQIQSRAKKKIKNYLATKIKRTLGSEEDEDDSYYPSYYYDSPEIRFRSWVNRELNKQAEKLYEDLVSYYPKFTNLILKYLSCKYSNSCYKCKNLYCKYDWDYPSLVTYRKKIGKIEPLRFSWVNDICEEVLEKYFEEDPFPEIIHFNSRYGNLFNKIDDLEKLQERLREVQSSGKKKGLLVSSKIQKIKEKFDSLVQPYEPYEDEDDDLDDEAIEALLEEDEDYKEWQQKQENKNR